MGKKGESCCNCYNNQDFSLSFWHAIVMMMMMYEERSKNMYQWVLLNSSLSKQKQQQQQQQEQQQQQQRRLLMLTTSSSSSIVLLHGSFLAWCKTKQYWQQSSWLKSVCEWWGESSSAIEKKRERTSTACWSTHLRKMHRRKLMVRAIWYAFNPDVCSNNWISTETTSSFTLQQKSSFTFFTISAHEQQHSDDAHHTFHWENTLLLLLSEMCEELFPVQEERSPCPCNVISWMLLPSWTI